MYWKTALNKGLITKSNIKGKKLTVITPKGRKIHFGAIGYEHYKDQTGIYKHLDHNDKDRRRRYRERHSKVLLKDGTPAYKDVEKPAYWSWYILW